MKKNYVQLLTGALNVTVAVACVSIIFSGGYIAQAQSGADIVCMVYDQLNQNGTPIPVLDASQCQNDPEDPPQCSDGVDNDGDGYVDEADGGCHSDLDGSNLDTYTPDKNNEIDPGVPPRPAENTLALCSDESDNDGNGVADLSDASCAPFTPSLIIEKNTTGGDGTFTFTVSGSISTTTIVTTAAGSGGSVQLLLSPGELLISEAPSDMWTLTGVSCSDGEASVGATTTNGVTLSLAIGDGVTCVFENTASTTPPPAEEEEDTTPAPPPSGGGSGALPALSGGGGNGPIFGSFGVSSSVGGLVLGAATTTVPATPPTPTSCAALVTTFMRLGGRNDSTDVMRLQAFLVASEGVSLALSGVYDAQTAAAVEAFQAKYAGDVLSPWGISSPTGIVYLTTRKKVNELHCSGQQQFPLTSSEQQVIDSLRGR